MDYRNIMVLIEKYFEGETSLQEEKQLRQYFQSPDLDPRLETYKPLFQYFKSEKQIGLSDDFDQKILEKISSSAIQAQTKVISLRAWAIRVAAVIMLGLGTWWLYPTEQFSEQQATAIDWSKFEPKNEEEALMIFRSALVKVSSKLNEGASTAAQEVTKIKSFSKILSTTSQSIQ